MSIIFLVKYYAEFSRNCLINNNISAFRKVINLYISYKLDTCLRDFNTDCTLDNSLFGSVKITKMLVLINMDILVVLLDSILVHNFYY